MLKFKFTKKQFEEATAPKKSGGESDAEESEEKKKLKETISNIDDEYKNSPNRTYGDVSVPNAVEKTYTKPTDEETMQKANDEISPLYEAKIESVTSKNNMERQNVEDEKDELYERAKESLKELQKTYENAKQNTSNEAIKRGLARSSIVLNQLSDLENSEINAKGGILSQRDKDLSNLSKKIDELKIKLLNDTNVLNEERAKEINQRVEELLDKYEQEEQDVFEYNNKLRQQRAETLAKLKEQGVNVDETQSKEYIKMLSDKTKTFYSYYYAFGEDALDELKKDKQYVVENIGEKGYENLVRYFN